MAARLHLDEDESPFGRPFTASQHSHVSAANSQQSPTSQQSTLPKAVAAPMATHQFDTGPEEVNAAKVMVINKAKELAILTASADRSVRIWLLRDSGQFWPSICHYMTSSAVSLAADKASRTVFVGTEGGLVSEFVLAEDFNRMEHRRDYLAHQAGVAQVEYCPKQKWLLSAGKDKYFQFHCTDTGRR